MTHLETFTGGRSEVSNCRFFGVSGINLVQNLITNAYSNPHIFVNFEDNCFKFSENGLKW